MPANRRGSLYIATLGVSTIVIVAGLSAMYVVRTRDRTAQLNRDIAHASIGARSAIEVFLQRAEDDANWRGAYTHDAWGTTETDGDIERRFRVADEADGDLLNNEADPLRVSAHVAFGDAVRIISVEIAGEQRRLAQVATNGDIESGLTGWSAERTSTLSVDTTVPYEGSSCLRVSGRPDSHAGAAIDLTSVLVNGGTYELSYQMRPTLGIAKSFSALEYTTSTGTERRSFRHEITGIDWSEIAGSFNANWTGTLISARLIIRTSSTQTFRLDALRIIGPDAGARQVLVFTPGSWRQEVGV